MQCISRMDNMLKWVECVERVHGSCNGGSHYGVLYIEHNAITFVVIPQMVMELQHLFFCYKGIWKTTAFRWINMPDFESDNEPSSLSDFSEIHNLNSEVPKL